MTAYTNHNWKSMNELLREIFSNPKATPMELELAKRIEQQQQRGHAWQSQR